MATVGFWRTSHLPGDVLRHNDSRTARRVPGQQISPAATLAHRQRNQIVYQASSKYPVTHRACSGKPKSRQDLHESVGFYALEECGARVMKKVQDTDAGKGFGNNVRQDRACGVGVHRPELRGDVIELG